jgi:hypothetical protein
MKVMRKEKILMKDHSDYVKSERDLLTAVTHPYIVALRFSFQVGGGVGWERRGVCECERKGGERVCVCEGERVCV